MQGPSTIDIVCLTEILEGIRPKIEEDRNETMRVALIHRNKVKRVRHVIMKRNNKTWIPWIPLKKVSMVES